MDRYTGLFKTCLHDNANPNSLPSNVPYGILEDDAGDLWMNTDNGLSRFDTVKHEFRDFVVRDGLQGHEFNTSAYAYSSRGEGIVGKALESGEDSDDQPLFTDLTDREQDVLKLIANGLTNSQIAENYTSTKTPCETRGKA